MTKLYAESFRGEEHLATVLEEAAAIVARGDGDRKAPPTSGGNVDGAGGLDRLAVGLG